MDVMAEAVGTVPGALVQAGPDAEFVDLYPRLYGAAYRVAFRLLGRHEDASDIAQEACARAYSRWTRIGRYDAPEGWVARVAANLTTDSWRAHERSQRHAALGIDASTRFDHERVDLHRALAALPRRQRQVVVLRYVADLSEVDVAAALGFSVGSVKTHASRGLAALRTTLSLEDE